MELQDKAGNIRSHLSQEGLRGRNRACLAVMNLAA
jgi:hypothetical protein